MPADAGMDQLLQQQPQELQQQQGLQQQGLQQQLTFVARTPLERLHALSAACIQQQAHSEQHDI